MQQRVARQFGDFVESDIYTLHILIGITYTFIYPTGTCDFKVAVKWFSNFIRRFKIMYGEQFKMSVTSFFRHCL